MPVCPNGTRVKPDITENHLWVEASDLCEQISWVATWMGPVCQQLLPRMVDIRELCATEPDPLPPIDLVGLAVAGQLTALPQLVADWIWAAWRQNNWSTFCECNPVVGPGPCVPPPKLYGNYSGVFYDGWKVLASQPIVAGFTRADFKVKNETVDGSMYIGVSCFQANGTKVWGWDSPTLGPGASYNGNSTEFGWAGANADLIAYMELGGREAAGAVETGQVSVEMLTLTGTCIGEVIPPAPTPEPEPPEPDAPPMPTVDLGCSLDDICAQLAAISGILGKLHERVGVLQRYGLPFTYQLGLVHAGLSGEGSFPIGALVGFKIDLTSAIPGRVLEGKPAYLWDLGWLTINTADGMIEEIRYTRDTQIWQPLRVQEARVFGYHFKAGVTATVTELVPATF